MITIRAIAIADPVPGCATHQEPKTLAQNVITTFLKQAQRSKGLFRMTRRVIEIEVIPLFARTVKEAIG
jgi:hypothetical protein